MFPDAEPSARDTAGSDIGQSMAGIALPAMAMLGADWQFVLRRHLQRVGLRLNDDSS